MSHDAVVVVVVAVAVVLLRTAPIRPEKNHIKTLRHDSSVWS